ncbi:37818_t:CDS:2, partial [Gigaspora margarita]
MSLNQDNSVTVEDETSSANSDIKTAHKAGQTNFETNFGRLSIDLLRFLYHELGIPETGVKQGLVNYLASEAKNRSDFIGLDNSEKASDDNSKYNFEAFSDGFCNASLDYGESRSKPSNYFHPLECLMLKMRCLLIGVFKRAYERSMMSRKPGISDHLEILCPGLNICIGKTSGAYVVSVADKDGWSVAVKIVASDIMDPMSELFSAKWERARIVVHIFLEPQPYLSPSWYSVPGQGTFASLPTFKWHRNEFSLQESSGPYFLGWRTFGIFCNNYLDNVWVAYSSRDILLNQREKVIEVDLKSTLEGLVVALEEKVSSTIASLKVLLKSQSKQIEQEDNIAKIGSKECAIVITQSNSNAVVHQAFGKQLKGLMITLIVDNKVALKTVQNGASRIAKEHYSRKLKYMHRKKYKDFQ